MTGTPGVECRVGGGNEILVVQFTAPLVTASAGISSGSASIDGSPRLEGDTLIVNLADVANGQTLSLAVDAVSDVFGQTLPETVVNVSFLLGDTNGDGRVNVGDFVQTRGRSGQAADGSNFPWDVNLDGRINVGDSIIVRSASGTSLP